MLRLGLAGKKQGRKKERNNRKEGKKKQSKQQTNTKLVNHGRKCVCERDASHMWSMCCDYAVDEEDNVQSAAVEDRE